MPLLLCLSDKLTEDLTNYHRKKHSTEKLTCRPESCDQLFLASLFMTKWIKEHKFCWHSFSFGGRREENMVPLPGRGLGSFRLTCTQPGEFSYLHECIIFVVKFTTVDAPLTVNNQSPGSCEAAVLSERCSLWPTRYRMM